MRAGIYVSVRIRAPLEQVWALSQDPDRHSRWDLRFSRIAVVDDGVPMRFEYERRIPLHVIRGTGISAGNKEGRGGRTSVLRFATEDPVSPLRSGRGYWRYRHHDGVTTFSTGYDYDPGAWRLLDRLILRRVIGWMTAWSFDRLRIWAERGEPPERWPLRSLLAFWLAERPRAARCSRTPPSGHAMSDAPPELDRLGAP